MRTVLPVGGDCMSRDRCHAFMERSGFRVVVAEGAREAPETI